MAKSSNSMGLPIAPAFARFEEVPANPQHYTMVTCTHPYHGHGVLYFSLEEYQTYFISVTSSLWINGYTLLIQPLN